MADGGGKEPRERLSGALHTHPPPACLPACCCCCRPWPYDRGLRRNCEEVFGRERRYWALPLHTPQQHRSTLQEALETPPPPEMLLGGCSRESV